MLRTVYKVYAYPLSSQLFFFFFFFLSGTSSARIGKFLFLVFGFFRGFSSQSENVVLCRRCDLVHYVLAGFTHIFLTRVTSWRFARLEQWRATSSDGILRFSKSKVSGLPWFGGFSSSKLFFSEHLNGETISLCINSETISLCINSDTISLCINSDTISLLYLQWHNLFVYQQWHSLFVYQQWNKLFM